MIEQRVTLRYGAQQIPAIVQAVQGDTGRDVIFELADYEIPAGATANYYIDKPDDTAIYNSAEVISSTEIRAHLTEQALAAPGRNNGQVRILSDGEVITSFDFVLEVEAFRGILQLQSETEVNIFDAAIQAAADEAIEEIQEQTPVVTGMQNSIAPTYSSSNTYAVGDYVMYNAQLYRCITAITTAEAWTAAHWTQVQLADDVNDLKSALYSSFDKVTVTHTASVTPEAGYVWPIMIPKDSKVTFVNNSSASMTLQVIDKNGTRYTITTTVVGNGGSVTFFAPVDVVSIRNYVGATSSYSASVTFENPTLLRLNDIDYIFEGYLITTTGNTNLYMHQGQKIIIDVTSNTIATNVFIQPNEESDPYITLAVGSGKYEFTAIKDGYLRLQNTGSSISAKAIVLTRYDAAIEELKAGGTYTVKKDGTGDYTSFVACLKDLAGNSENKTILVYPGVYDIYEENGGDDFIASITDPASTNWRSVNAVVPPNTHVVGMGNVELRFAPEAAKIGSNAMAFLFSPLNISGNCEIENISVFGSNCRYAIHDETSGLSQFNDAEHIYKNVRARKEHGTYGNDQVFGSGFGSRGKMKFESCEFTSDRSGIWTTHTNPSNQYDGGEIIFNNCIFKKDNDDDAAGIVQFIVGASNNAAIENIVKLNSCSVAGSVTLYTNETPDTIPNRYNMTSLKSTVSGNFDVSSNFSENPYPVKIYS